MKIYIDEININNLNIIQKKLDRTLYKTKIYTELYTNESIYHIDAKNIYLLKSNDESFEIYKNYFKNINLIVDKSYFKKSIERCVYGNKHQHKKIKKYIYKLNPISKICFIVESYNDLENNKFILNDIYFECNDLVDIKELFIKQEIIEFLSLLI